jgi:hypothetical protein
MTRFRAALLIALSLAPVNPTRAGELDRLLDEELIPKLRNALLDAGFQDKAVGFLPFRSRTVEGKQSFNAGPINTQLPEMIALSLLSTDDPKLKGPRFQILRDAADTAADKKVGLWFQKKEERRKLFKSDFPVLWADQTARADVFVTGLVRLSADAKEATVVVESFTANDLALKPLAEATVPTTRSILRSLGFSFELRPELIKKSRLERDAAAAREVRERGMKVKEPEFSPEGIGGLKLEVFYNGEKQKVETRRGKRGELEFHLPSPRRGQKVTMAVTHLDTEKEPLGFVLRVNGENTWEQERLDAEQCQPWLLKPGRSMTFSGFSFVDREGKTREQPWKVLSDDDSRRRLADFGDKTGTIDLDVFSSGSEVEDIPLAMDRGVLKKPSDFASFRKAVDEFTATKGRSVRNRGVLVRDENVTAKEFQTERLDFVNPVPRAGITIRYYAPDVGEELDITE